MPRFYVVLKSLFFLIPFAHGSLHAKETCSRPPNEPVCILKVSSCHPHISGQGTQWGSVRGAGNVLLQIIRYENGEYSVYQKLEGVTSYDSVSWQANPDDNQLSLPQAIDAAVNSCEGELKQFKALYPPCVR